MSLVQQYRAHTEERAKLCIPPLPLTAEQARLLIDLLKQDLVQEKEYLLELFREHISPGVDDAAFEKAAFLDGILKGDIACSVINTVEAVRILGTMLGGYNVKPLVDALSHKDPAICSESAVVLKKTLLVYDMFDVVVSLAKTNRYAEEVLKSCADAEWFTT